MVIGLVKMLYKQTSLHDHAVPQLLASKAFSIKATVCWGLVMWLFRNSRQSLQPSLQASMQYLYLDSNYWTGLTDFLFVNKRDD